MKSKHWILLLLVPLSNIKALFYNSDLRVSWYLFSDNKRYLCNVLEDYSNMIIFGTLFFYLCFVQIDKKTRKISLFLFITTIFNFIHLGLMDMDYFVSLKIIAAYIVYKLCNRYGTF